MYLYEKTFFIFFLLCFLRIIRTDKYEPVTHVIFDMDGLLLNTEAIYYDIISELCAKYGKVFTKEIKEKMMGISGSRGSEIVIKELNLPVTLQDFVEQRTKMKLQRLCNVKILPGVEKLFKQLHRSNISFAIATGSSLESYQMKIQKFKKLFSLVDHVTAALSNPDVKNGKPDPDVFLVCAKQFKDQPYPNKCLVFEDGPVGVTAALRAGMQVVMVPNPNHVTEDSKKNATLVIDSLENFHPEWFGLPAFPKIME